MNQKKQGNVESLFQADNSRVSDFEDVVEADINAN